MQIRRDATTKRQRNACGRHPSGGAILVRQCPGGWWSTRFHTCTWRHEPIDFINLETGDTVGSYDVTIWDEIVTGKNSGTFYYNQYVWMYNQQGDWMQGNSWLRGTSDCSGRCQMGSLSPKWPVEPAKWLQWSTAWNSTVPLPGRGPMALDGALTWSSSDEEEMLTYFTEPAPIIRCDDGMLKGQPSSEGCVVREYWPTLVYKYSEVPEVVTHIRWSQALGSPGAEGGSPLQRMYNDDDAQENRNTACADAPNPRPNGMQCDEYPMARTYQGAYTCGCDDWTWRLVPATQNELAGNQYGIFAGAMRLLDGDAFYVNPDING